MRKSCTKCNNVAQTSTLSSGFLQKLQQCGSIETASAEILHKLQQQSTVTAHLRLLILMPPLSTKSPAPLHRVAGLFAFLYAAGSPPSERPSTEVRSSACYPTLFPTEICPTSRHPSPARRSPVCRPRSSSGAGRGCGGSGRRAGRR